MGIARLSTVLERAVQHHLSLPLRNDVIMQVRVTIM